MAIGNIQTGSHRSRDSAGRSFNTRNPPAYARLPKDIDDVVAKDTIYIHDLAYALPDRCQRRRRVFQGLQNRYIHQILYGCVNPRCETPTCLSHRKRVSMDPFRPYTVSSARTLAAFLASEDHPENGLCPYRPMSFPGVSCPKSVAKASQTREKASCLTRDPTGSQALALNGHPSYNGSVKTPIGKADANGHLEPALERAPRSDQNVIKDIEISAAQGRSQEGKRTREVKDTKSFAQSLFDTAAMKLLNLGNFNQSVLGWAGWAANDRPGGFSEDVNHPRDLNNGSIYCQSLFDEDRNLKSDPETHVKSKRYSKIPSNADDMDTENVPAGPLHSDSEAGGDSGIYSSPIITAKSDFNLGFEFSGQEYANGTIATEAWPISLPKGSVINQDLKRFSNISADLQVSINGGVTTKCSQQRKRNGFRVDTSSSGVRLDPVMSPQSLSHFSHANIKSLVATISDKYRDLFKEHQFLRSRGRLDFPLRSSTRLSDKDESYRAILAFSAQSIVYVLSNAEALMKSFLHLEVTNSPRMTIQPYAVHDMVDCFLRLRSLDFHPQRVLPSLWTSAGYIRPWNSVGKRTASIQHDSALIDGLYDPINDFEASHVAKIAFAALIAMVPAYGLEAMDAVAALHRMGQVILPIDHGNTPMNRKLHKKTLNTVVVFENEMALEVAKRVVRAIMARHQGARSRQGEGDHSVRGGYMCQVVDDLLSIIPKISVANDQACPSLRGGSIIAQDRLEIAENVQFPCRVIIEWLRTILLKEWDGKALVRKCSAVGAALPILEEIFLRKWVGIDDMLYQTPFLSGRLNLMEDPLDWVESEQDDAFVHLLSYPFLFPPSVLYSYFRVINYDAMYKAFEGAAMAENLMSRMTFAAPHSNRGKERFQDQLRIAQTHYLVLEVRREDVLTDAMDQLWRRQKSELMKPLKVCMGMDEGEEGVDHGGVQQEFFRVAIAEALDPKYGAFTTDSQTHMSWFQPGSLEPLHKFELLGLLVSLAVYNGLTLPFSFPTAFYSNLLGLPVTTLADIEDGWPELANGLRTLRDWSDDNVEEVFARPFVFSVDVFGMAVDVDMDKTHQNSTESLQQGGENQCQAAEENYEKGKALSAHPPTAIETSTHSRKLKSSTSKEKLNMELGRGSMSSHHWDICPASSSHSSQENEAHHITDSAAPITKPESNPFPEPKMVTSSNRHDYITRYIAHLTHHSIEPQLQSFSRGFFTCISHKSITLFSPSQLKHLIEGLPSISIPSLYSITKYEGGYHQNHPTIMLFWGIVESWPQEKVRQLMEFVTASDRLPAGGMERVTFVVQRNGTGEGRWLPTSLTCFGRLLLPEYRDEETMRKGLETAIENSKGFGQP